MTSFALASPNPAPATKLKTTYTVAYTTHSRGALVCLIASVRALSDKEALLRTRYSVIGVEK